jgi:5'-3' exonuclease
VNKGIADADISEYSDLLTFGCKKVIYEMDEAGNGGQISYDDIFKEEQLQMTEFTPEMFRYTCIISSCDYLPSLCSHTNSIKRARGILQRHPTIHKVSLFYNIRKKKNLVLTYLSFPSLLEYLNSTLLKKLFIPISTISSKLMQHSCTNMYLI